MNSHATVKRNLNDLLYFVMMAREGNFTRSVSPAVAGERLLQAIGHRFDEIEAELDVLTEMRDKPAGTARTTCGEHVLRATQRLPPISRPLMGRSDSHNTRSTSVTYSRTGSQLRGKLSRHFVEAAQSASVD